MSLLSKVPEAINESDLQELVDNAVAENKHVEYKELLPGNSDSDKKEFLADVSSFANASGGDLIFGMKASKGVPTQFCGLQISSADQEISRLENIIRSGLAPRIHVHIWPVGKIGSQLAIIIRVRKSWNAPHMVTFGDHSKFYSRNSNGKYALDVSELRAAFLLTDTISERVNRFRFDRLDKIQSGETPVSLMKNPKIVLHLIPFGSFDPASKFDVSTITTDLTKLRSPYLESTGVQGRYNLEGYIAYSHLASHELPCSNLQIFRSGIIEMVDAFLLRNSEKKIYSYNFEGDLLKSLPRYFSLQRQLGVDTPIFVMMTLLGVAGFRIVTRLKTSWIDTTDEVDRNDLVIPEVIVDEFDRHMAQIMKPVFDAVWNAAGRAGSLNYDDKGEWHGLA
jgi:hypothetical protein